MKYVKGGTAGAPGPEPPGDDGKLYTKAALYFNGLAVQCAWDTAHEAVRRVSGGGGAIQRAAKGDAREAPVPAAPLPPGHRVAVFYEEENMFFPGTVAGPPDAEGGLYPVDLDRGTSERLDLNPVKLYNLSSVTLMGCPEFGDTSAARTNFADQRVAVYNSRTNAMHLGTVSRREGGEASTRYLVVFDDGLAKPVDFDIRPVYWLGGKAEPLAGPGMSGVTYLPESQKFLAQAPGTEAEQATEHFSADAAALACDLQAIRADGELHLSKMNTPVARRPIGVLEKGRTRRLAVAPWPLPMAQAKQPGLPPGDNGGGGAASGPLWSQLAGEMGRAGFRLQRDDLGGEPAQKEHEGSKPEEAQSLSQSMRGQSQFQAAPFDPSEHEAAGENLEEVLRASVEFKAKQAQRDAQVAALRGTLEVLTARQRQEVLDRQKILQIGLRVDALEKEAREIRQRIAVKERELEELTCLGLDELRGGSPAAQK